MARNSSPASHAEPMMRPSRYWFKTLFGGVGLFLVPLFGFNAACFSGPIAWILADSFLIPMYYHVIHRAKRGEGIY